MNMTNEFDLRDLVKRHVCYADIAREVDMDPRTIKKIIIREGIDVSHFLGKAKFKGMKRKIEKITTRYIKKDYLNEGKLMNQCYTCGQEPFWNGKPMVLRMVHLDGNSNNNDIHNIIMQCPNCFSQIQSKNVLVFLNSCRECNKAIPENLVFCSKCKAKKISKEMIKNELVKTGFEGVRKKYGMDKEEIINYINNSEIV